jgi:hypothetical protein
MVNAAFLKKSEEIHAMAINRTKRIKRRLLRNKQSSQAEHAASGQLQIVAGRLTRVRGFFMLSNAMPCCM